MVIAATFPDGKEFYRLIDAMSALLDDIHLIISKDGLRIATLDNDHIVMVDLWLPKDSFLKYNYRNKQETKAGLSLRKLKKTLVWATVEPLQLSFLPRSVKFSQNNADGVTKEIEQSYVDIEQEKSSGTPQVDWLAEVTCSSYIFSNTIKCSDNVHDTINLTVKPRSFELEIKGNDYINGKVILNKKTQTGTPEGPEPGQQTCQLQIETKEKNISQLFSIKFFRYFVGAAELSSKVQLSMHGEDKPIKVCFPLNDSDGYLAFFLAPKVSSDD